ncbi:MAG: Holliday junction resolvase RuvX [Patescibacteria group bacterium]|nr:Holliday junction resolvase RuvX [Patescibacteria group bacterium]
MRILGVDYGTRRVGLAVADDELNLPLPLKSVTVGSLPEAVTAVATIVKEEMADVVVVGMPRRMSGEGPAGETEQAVQEFIAALGATVKARIETEDERMTTAAAVSERHAVGASTREFDRDAVAAANILETWLARQKINKP